VTAVRIDGLCVTLGRAEVVHGVGAAVEHGEWVALIGPNGAGKTTILRAIAGLVPFAGSVQLDGRAVDSNTRRQMARSVALVPQKPETPPALTVAEYILLGRTPHIAYLATEGREDRLAAERAIERLALQPFVQRSLDSLSGGELQRVVLARALAQEAPLLLLDEPTSALDLGRQQQVLELVDELRAKRGLTVVSTMHDLTLAGQYADRLLLLDGGRLVAAGSPHDVLTRTLITEHYGAEVAVVDAPGSGFVVVPVRRAP